MTWNLKKTTTKDEDSTAAANRTKSPKRPKKRSGAKAASQTDAPSQARRAAGIVLRPAAAQAAGRSGQLPELLYGGQYDCAFCRGTGQWPNDSQCPVCRGNGKVSVPAPAVRCAFCHGRGRKTSASTVTCLVCKGMGIVAMTPPVEVCPECRGRGKKRGQSLYCGRCRGAGVVASLQQKNDSGGASTDIETGPDLERKAS